MINTVFAHWNDEYGCFCMFVSDTERPDVRVTDENHNPACSFTEMITFMGVRDYIYHGVYYEADKHEIFVFQRITK